MSAPKPNAERSPRRKAGRKPAPNAKRTVTFRLVVEGQEMIVTYEPNWSESEFPCGHFEFRSPHEPPRRIPLSETGYRSHFAPTEEIAGYESPEAYARAFVLASLAPSRKEKGELPDDRQLSLF